MYEEYYGFVRPPFSLTPDPRFLYRSESHDVALQQVWQAIRRKEGFIVLTGDIGTGKTTLCRTLLEQFDPTTFTSLILNPFLSIEELLREVLLSYGIASKDTLRTGRLSTASKHELIRTLHDFLLSLVPIHGSAVLIIDEAQHLSREVLEEIRILSNLETNEQKLLQIVLVGQLNLLNSLQDAKLRQLNQRISIRCLLRALNREEVDAYITHRLWVARGSTSIAFTPRAIDIVHAISGGVPRMINLLCDRALMLACDARSDTITETLIADAATGLGLTVPPVRRRDALRAVGANNVGIGVGAGIAVMLILVAAAGIVVGNPLEALAPGDPPSVPRLQPASLGIRDVALPNTASLAPPPFTDGSFSVLVGTYAAPREVAAAEALLRARGLRYYAVDLRLGDGIRRRLLLGRYATSQQAEKIRVELSSLFANARVVTAATERLP